MSLQADQLDLLCRVLTAGLEEAGVERGARDEEDEALDAERKVGPCVLVCVCV